MKRTAHAIWTGAGKDGKGVLTTESGTLKETSYSFRTRFGDDKGTNPEELIAAAHAGCFSMALAFALGNEGFTPEKIQTNAVLTMEQQSNGWAIKAVHLELSAKVPNIDDTAFQKIAVGAKENCPVSKILNAEITLEAKLDA
jgi:lipoyl-dependent peroxiredoxin